MVKKGKFKFLSYVIEDNLVYYKSQGKYEKFVAFAILELKSFNPLISILIEFLKKNLIQYFAFQLETFEKNIKSVILNFQDSKREQIVKTFNIVKQRLIESDNQFQLLNKELLESRFISPILEDLDSKVSIVNKAESILITNDKDVKLLDFFKINLELVKNRNSFIYNFLNLINNFKQSGYLIFNFKIGFDNDIKTSIYFVEVREKNERISQILKKVNKFFNFDLLERKNVKIKDLFNFLWRLGISNENFPLENFKILFNNKDQNTALDFLKYTNKFEENLLQNEINYLQLSTNLYFIDQQFLFLILNKLDSDYIHKILEKYIPKYIIYITIFQELDYEQLLNIKTINQIENIKILHPNDILDLNYKIFKDIEI